MKLKKNIFVCLIFIPFFQINGQIEQEIKSFVDSTEQLVNNGRKLLLEEVRLYNLEKANKIYTFLNQKAAEKQCEVFTYNEHLLISMLTSDWSSFTKKVENFSTSNVSLCYRSSQIMERELYEEVIKFNDRIQKQIQIAEISQEDKDLLHLFQYIFQQEKNEKMYGIEKRLFSKHYPLSPYSEFVKTYLPSPSTPASFTMAFGAVAAFPQGNLKNMYSDGVGFGMDFDVCINKVYVSLFINTTPLKLNEPFYAFNEENTRYDFLVNDKFDYFQGGAKVGYYALRKSRLHLAPYLSLGGASLTSDIYKNQQDNNKELKMFNSFFTGPGIHSEFKIFEYKEKTTERYNYYNYTPSGYVSLKLDGGYNFITNQKDELLKGNMFYASLSLVWGLGGF